MTEQDIIDKATERMKNVSVAYPGNTYVMPVKVMASLDAGPLKANYTFFVGCLFQKRKWVQHEGLAITEWYEWEYVSNDLNK